MASEDDDKRGEFPPQNREWAPVKTESAVIGVCLLVLLGLAGMWAIYLVGEI